MRMFQSSPGQKAGCKVAFGGVLDGSDYRRVVSILTRPEGRVQARRGQGMTKVSAYLRCFNPHPARRPGCKSW